MKKRATLRAALAAHLPVYVSMFSLLIVLFFSATGLTLNHPDWFGQGEARPRETEGKVQAE